MRWQCAHCEYVGDDSVADGHFEIHRDAVFRDENSGRGQEMTDEFKTYTGALRQIVLRRSGTAWNPKTGGYEGDELILQQEVETASGKHWEDVPVDRNNNVRYS